MEVLRLWRCRQGGTGGGWASVGAVVPQPGAHMDYVVMSRLMPAGHDPTTGLLHGRPQIFLMEYVPAFI
jgi:hypothetical protein